MIVALAIVMAWSARAIVGELRVAAAERAISAWDAAGPAVDRDDGGPPRRQLAIAAALARRAQAVGAGPVRRALLDRAGDALDRAAAARPEWGDVWAMRAYAATLSGDERAATAALGRSYRDAAFLPGSGMWRIGYGLAHWDALPDTSRQAVTAEAVWLSEVDRGAREAIFASARHSPAYRTFLLRWRTETLRARDLDRSERASP